MKSIFCTLSVFTILLTSCTKTEDHITLSYQPAPAIETIENAENCTIDLLVIDNRPSKTVVSTKRSGGGHDNGAIISDTNIPELIKEALRKELVARGFTITEGAAETSLISVEINKFYGNYKLGIWSHSNVSEVAFLVQVKKRDGTLSYERNIKGFGDHKDILLMNGKNAKPALEEALKASIEKLMNDKKFIRSLTNND